MGFHHIELWVSDDAEVRPRWDWLLKSLGWTDYQDWRNGHSWQAEDGSYLVIEASSDLSGQHHDRNLPGMNHLAVTATRGQVDAIVADCAAHGWQLLFPQAHPYAGGRQHYAAYLSDEDGFEVEIVATDVN